MSFQDICVDKQWLVLGKIIVRRVEVRRSVYIFVEIKTGSFIFEKTVNWC